MPGALLEMGWLGEGYHTMAIYCIYKGERYKPCWRDGRMYIVSETNLDDFSSYYDVLGRKYDDLFMKYLDVSGVNLLYDEEVLIKYRGEYFELDNLLIRKRDVRDDSYRLSLESYEKAKEFEFIQTEPLLFSKEIKRSEIEAIKVIQTPIKKFSYISPTETILEGAAIDEWLANLLR